MLDFDDILSFYTESVEQKPNTYEFTGLMEFRKKVLQIIILSFCCTDHRLDNYFD